MLVARANLTTILCTCGLALLFIATAQLPAQCLSLEYVQINGCTTHPNPSGSVVPVETEFLVFRTRSEAVPVARLSIDLPFNGFGAQNGDIDAGIQDDGRCRLNTLRLTQLPGLPGAVILRAADTIPPNSFVVLFTSGATTDAEIATLDFSNLPGLFDLPVFFLQSTCSRTVGAFANNPPASGTNFTRTVSISTGCGTSTITYDTRSLTGQDGDFYSVAPASRTGNAQNCVLPDLPFHSLCQSTDAITQWDCTRDSVGSEYVVNLRQALDVQLPGATYYLTTSYDPDAEPVTELRGTYGETVRLLAVQPDLGNECLRLTPVVFVFNYLRGDFVCEPIVAQTGRVRGIRGQVIDTVGDFNFVVARLDAIIDAFEGSGTTFVVNNLPPGAYFGLAVTQDSCLLGECVLTIDEPLVCPVIDTTITFVYTEAAPQINPITGGIFTPEAPRDSLVVQTDSGCDSTVFTVAVFPEVFSLRNERLYLPTAFSPNGDGVNDVLLVGSGDDIQVARTRVHDRWGGLVYEGADGWDGFVGGERAPRGVYVLTVEAVTLSGRVVRRSGAVSLL